jgi:hypothetical protein
VRQQVADRDGITVVWQFGHPLPDVVVQRQPALEREQHDGCRGELFADRAGFENRVGVDGQRPLEILLPIDASEPPRAGRVDSHYAAGRGDRINRAKKRVDACRLRAERTFGCRERQDGEQDRNGGTTVRA